MSDNDYYQPTTSSTPADKPAEDAKVDEPIAQPEPPATPVDASPPEAEMTPPEAARAADSPAEAYNVFVDELVRQLGFNDLEGKEKDDLVDAIKERVETRILRVLVTSLTKEQSDAIDKEIEEKGLSEEAIIKLLSETAPNASSAILSALDDLYTEMKEETDLIWKTAAGKAVADQEEGEKAPEESATAEQPTPPAEQQ
jgi:hypothetical protein